MEAKTIQGYEKLKSIYEDNLSVGLLGEELRTCRQDADGDAVKASMDHLNFDVFGVEEDGKIVGYVKREQVGSGKVKSYV